VVLVVVVVVVEAVVVVRALVVVGSTVVLGAGEVVVASEGADVWASLRVQAVAATAVAIARVRSVVDRRIRVRST
jgi:hypothetical protein